MRKYGCIQLGLAVALAGVVGCGEATSEDIASLEAAIGGTGGSGIIFGGAGGVVVDFVNGGAGFKPVQDTTIEAAAPDTWQGDAATCTADGLTRERACLMSFNITSIPFNATVLEASLFLTILDRSNRWYELTALKRGWSGTLATTWNKALLGDPWAIPGAKGATDREPAAFFGILPNAVGRHEYVFDAPAIAQVQRWVSEPPANNRGFVISRADVSDGFIMVSSEGADPYDRPRLRVRYR
jgi:hypothetical protein